MRPRSLLLAAGACLATLTLTVGTAIADPTPTPSPTPSTAAGPCPGTSSTPTSASPQFPGTSATPAATTGASAPSSGAPTPTTAVPPVDHDPGSCFTQYGLPPNTNPSFITTGPDGNLWFTGNNVIGRMETRGKHTVTIFPVPLAQSILVGITTGPDGNMWFTDYFGHVGRILTHGSNTITIFNTPGTGAQQIIAGPDGALWFGEYDTGRIGRIQAQAPYTVTEFPVATGDIGLTGITVGQDGNIWLTEQTGNHIDRILTRAPHTITRFALPPHPGVYQQSNFPYGITSGIDGKIWFTMVDTVDGKELGSFSPFAPTATLQEFSVPTAPSQPVVFTNGPDLRLWYTDNGPDYRQFQSGANVQAISLFGKHTITQYSLYDVHSRLTGITAGPLGDDSIWFTETQTNSIGRIDVGCADHEDQLNSLPGKRLDNLGNQGCNDPDNS